MKTEMKITLNDGSSARSVTYNGEDAKERKKAHMEFFKLTSEEYDEIKERNDSKHYPLIENLRCHDGQIYYLDDNGNKIMDVDKHLAELTNKHYN